MEGNFSNRVQDVIRLSREEALRLGHDYIGTEHLLLGIIREGEGIAVKILRNLGCDLYKLKKAIEDTVRLIGRDAHDRKYPADQTSREGSEDNLPRGKAL